MESKISLKILSDDGMGLGDRDVILKDDFVVGNVVSDAPNDAAIDVVVCVINVKAVYDDDVDVVLINDDDVENAVCDVDVIGLIDDSSDHPDDDLDDFVDANCFRTWCLG